MGGSARSRRQDRALFDFGSGRQWTFAQLADWGEHRTTRARQSARAAPAPEFIRDVLRGWRHGRIVCPLDSGQVAPPPAEWPPDWAHLKTSSGSAGAPRMIGFTPAQIAADAGHIVATMGLRQEWPNLGCISLAHSYGFSNLVLPLLLHGIPLALLPSRLPESVRLGCAQFRQVTLPAVPALWRVWFEAGALGDSIRLAISAGAPLPRGLEADVFAATGLKIHNFYGASECGGICYDASPIPRTNDEEVGTPLAGVRVETDEAGHLTVFSGAAGESYWPEPSPDLGRGRFQTTDCADIRDGRVFLRGRGADIINVAGQKIAPELIERAILRHPGVRECIVFGVPERDRGEAIVACISTRHALGQEALREFVGAFLPAWQTPREWWVVPELADAERGKISRAKWRERFLQMTNGGARLH